MDRLTFIKNILGAFILAIPVSTAIGCSGSDGDSDGNGNGNGNGNGGANCLDNGTNSSIAGNHGHSLTVSKADVSSGVVKVYSIQGSADHSHNVTVSASNFTSLKSNQQIQVTSTSGDAHTHSVTVSCA